MLRNTLAVGRGGRPRAGRSAAKGAGPRRWGWQSKVGPPCNGLTTLRHHDPPGCALGFEQAEPIATESAGMANELSVQTESLYIGRQRRVV